MKDTVFYKGILFFLALSALLMAACTRRGDSSQLAEETAYTAPTEPVPEATASPVSFPNGTVVPFDSEEVKLKNLRPEDVETVAELLLTMPNVNKVVLNEEADAGNSSLTPWNVSFLQNECKGITFEYYFILYGKVFSTLSESVDLNHISMEDDGRALEEALPCMKSLKYLDCDSCGLPDEQMDRIRTEYPDTEVVWRIWFGENNVYSVRTNVERILASDPYVGQLTTENTGSLKYCTKVKRMDLGHNNIKNIDFLYSMPDLEILILSLNPVTDLSPLSACKKLEYLEIDDLKCSDISPLKDHYELKHLNISALGEITGYEVLYDLKQLERLWVGAYTTIPEEDMETLKAALPDTEINTTDCASVTLGWRYADGRCVPRYQLLREQMSYGDYPRQLSYYWNDPLY